MNLIKNEANHPRFLKRLRGSINTVWFIARWFFDMDYHVLIKKNKESPSRAEALKYVDQGDISISHDLEIWHEVEVKGQRKICFSSHYFPYPDIVVCAKHSFDNKTKEPKCYVSVSLDKKAIGIIWVAKTKQHWIVKPIPDSEYNETQICYCCPKELVQWVDLE